MASARKETERTKFIQDKCQSLLTQMLRDEDNKYCVDCDAKGPRWASWNLGVFLCIRCAGIHRNLGVHISRVRSVNLDTWSPEQVVSLQNMGNSRARAVYEAQLPDGFRRPQTDSALETFIRAKYEHKKYMAREWVPGPPAVANWDKEIDDEMEQQKRAKKKSTIGGGGGASSGSAGAFGALSAVSKSESSSRKPTAHSTAPVVLAKPAPSPKSTRGVAAAAAAAAQKSAAAAAPVSSASSDLLGLSMPAPTNGSATTGAGASNSTADDLFSNFLSAPPAAACAQATQATVPAVNGAAAGTTTLAEQEADFFNQVAPTEQEKGKMTRDSILALYGQSTPMAAASGAGFGQFNMAPVHNQQQQHHHQQMGGFAAFGSNPANPAASPFGVAMPPVAQSNANMYAAFGNTTMGGGGGGGVFGAPQPLQQQQQQPSFAQFPPMAGSAAGLGAFGSNGFGASTAAPTLNGGATTAGLTQKLSGLNLGNVWQ